MPKKQRNSFYFFLKELQETYRMEGKNVSMKELPTIAHPLWKDLPESEKLRYENLAKQYKVETKEDPIIGRLCSDGTSLINIMKAETEEQEKAEEAVKFVERLVSQKENKETVAESSFFIMVFNVMCCTNDGQFIPLEVGISKYSIKNGIEDSFHIFIEPGPIPIGYTRISIQHSNETHKIPVTDFELSENNYRMICKSIENFINPNRSDITPVFCLEENMKQNQSCLEWLSKKVQHCNLEGIQYYNIAHLLMELRAYAHAAFPSKTNAVDILGTSAFDYTPNIRCDFHEEIDNPFCALSCAKRLGFILSDALCELYGVDCTPQHLPPRVGDFTDFETYRPKLPPTAPIKNVVDIPVKPPKPHIITTIIKKEVPKNNERVFQTGQCASGFAIPNSTTKSEKSFSKDDFPSLNESLCPSGPPSLSEPTSMNKPPGNENADIDLRQPNTLPFVLSRGVCMNQDKRYAALSLGRGIGRGRQIPQNSFSN